MSDIEARPSGGLARKGRTLTRVVVGTVAVLVGIKMALVLVGLVGLVLSVVLPVGLLVLVAYALYALFRE